MSMAVGGFWLAMLVGSVGFVLNHFLPLFLKLGLVPKGSFGWPLLGETLAFLKPHPSNSVGNFLQDHCSRYGKVFKSHLFFSPTVVSCDQELNYFILQNEDKLFQCSYPKPIHGILGDISMLVAVGDIHKRLRNVALSLVTTMKSKPEFLKDIERTTIQILNSWKDRQQVIFCDEARKFTFNVIVKQVLGLTSDEPETTKILEDFRTFMKGLISLPLNIPGTAYARAVKARRRISSTIKAIIEERRKNAGKSNNRSDFLETLLCVDSLSEDEKVSFVLDSLLGGYETTSVLMALVVHFLGQSPIAFEQLKVEHQNIRSSKKEDEFLNWEDYRKMDFTQNVISEALRYGNVVKFVHRKALKDVKFKDYIIPCGWKVLPVLSAVHLDPSLHADALQFHPWRWESEDQSTSKEPSFDLEDRMPQLTDPKIIASMRSAVSDVAQARSVLKTLGDRPDHEAVDTAKAKLFEIESQLSKQHEEIVLSPELRDSAEKDRQVYKAVISLDEMHEAYEKLVMDAEARLMKIYEAAVAGRDVEEDDGSREVVDEVNEEVVGILQEASSGKGIERIDLSGRLLRLLPEAFGRLRGLVVLILSSNQLQVIPDSIGGLENLDELHLSSNLLESLPDSIGLLLNLKILDVSGNKLVALPDSICQCRSLVELDASFNRLAYLPTNIGYELVNLKCLLIHLNKIRSLPSSIGEMRSLCIMDVHFNELRGLPLAIGRLTNLETLNLSSNFSDLTELPDTFGDLTNLKELDLSNNQIHALPDTFGRLDNLTKLNLEANPLVIPPKEVVSGGAEAIKDFMAKRWLDILVEEERKSMLEVEEQSETGWLSRSTSWLNNFVSDVSGHMKSPVDPCLNQQL